MSVTTLETDAYWTSNYSSAVSTRPINSTAASSTINAMRDVCAASVSVERLRHPISAWCLYSDISYSSLVARPSVILSAVAAVMEARTPERQSLTQHRVSATATGEGYWRVHAHSRTPHRRARWRWRIVSETESQQWAFYIPTTRIKASTRRRPLVTYEVAVQRRERERETICQQKILRLAQKLRVIDIRQRTA